MILRRSQIIRLIEKIQDEHGERKGKLAFDYLRAVLNWHAPRSDDFKSPIVAGMVKYDTGAHARSRVLSDDEIRAFWQATEAKIPFNRLARFLLLTGSRYGEAAGLIWSEIVDGVWHLPAARNKTPGKKRCSFGRSGRRLGKARGPPLPPFSRAPIVLKVAATVG